jgi:hypothetical protein
MADIRFVCEYCTCVQGRHLTYYTIYNFCYIYDQITRHNDAVQVLRLYSEFWIK